MHLQIYEEVIITESVVLVLQREDFMVKKGLNVDLKGDEITLFAYFSICNLQEVEDSVDICNLL